MLKSSTVSEYSTAEYDDEVVMRVQSVTSEECRSSDSNE